MEQKEAPAQKAQTGIASDETKSDRTGHPSAAFIAKTFADIEPLMPELGRCMIASAAECFIPGTQKTLSVRDEQILKSEIPVRVMFGQDEDATGLMWKMGIVQNLFADSKMHAEPDSKMHAECVPDDSVPNYPYAVTKSDEDHDLRKFGKRALLMPVIESNQYFPTVQSVEEFKIQWDAFTLGVLGDALDHLPIVVAGGSVLAALVHWPVVLHEHGEPNLRNDFTEFCMGGNRDREFLRARYRSTPAQSKLELQTSMTGVTWTTKGKPRIASFERSATTQAFSSFRGADIDIFLTTRDPDLATKTIIDLYAIVRKNIPIRFSIPIMRTAYSVTFMPPWPYRKIQIITRLYFSAPQVILGFDIDSCCFSFDGSSVLGLTRARRAIELGYNLVDPSRQSTSYEYRLAKYARRGFHIALPGAVGANPELPLRAPNRSRFQDLLEALFFAKQSTNALGTVHSDYDFPAGKARARICWAARRGTSVPFAYHKSDLRQVLSTADAVARDGKEYACRSTVSPMITFQIKAPHLQAGEERTPISMFSGSFHPRSGPWYSVESTESPVEPTLREHPTESPVEPTLRELPSE